MEALNWMKRALVLSFFCLLEMMLGGCDGGTSTGNPVVMEFDQFDSNAPLTFKHVNHGVYLLAVSDLKMCFKRMRFKPDGSSAGDNIDLLLGEVTIDPTGTDLGHVKVAVGTYRRVEFDLEDDCNGYSLEVTNNNGTFQTNDRITIKFEGEFLVRGGGASVLTMAVQDLVDVMNSVNSVNDIKPFAESVTGSF